MFLNFRADNDYEKRLPREKLYAVSTYEPLQEYVRKADYAFYQALVEVLIPDVLRPIPSKFKIFSLNFSVECILFLRKYSCYSLFKWIKKNLLN